MSDGTPTTTESCPECGSNVDWGISSWCPSCGYYPAIDFRSQDHLAPPEEEVLYEHWWEVVPGWLWSLVTGTCLIVLFSGVVRVMFVDSPIRTWWTIGQTVGGLVALGTVHFMAYLYSASRSDKLGPLDMLLKPVVTWQPVLHNLPETSNLVCWCAFSATAFVSGYFVVGGIDAGEVVRQQAIALQRQRMQQREEERQRRDSPLCIAISTATAIAQAQQAACGGMPVPCTLEESLYQFAVHTVSYDRLVSSGGGKTGLRPAQMLSPVSMSDESIPESIRRDSLPPTQRTGFEFHDGSNAPKRDGVPDLSTTGTAAERQEVECLILGYTTNTTGEIRSLLLAAAPDRRFLRFVGKIPVEQVAPSVLETLLQRFAELPARRPMVRCPYGGRWVRPELFCLTSYESWTADGRLHNAEVTQLMNTEAN